MDAKEMMYKLSMHPVVRADMSMQVQIGLPFLEKRMEKLCVRCLPHREEIRDEYVKSYLPRYKITWVYPFDKIISFKDLAYFHPMELSEPVSSVKTELYVLRGKYILKDMYEQCSELLAAYEQDGKVSDVALRRYQKIYYETVRQLGLTNVYGEDEL